MELNKTDTEWLKDAPTLAALDRRVPFTVPEGYFDGLSKTIKGRVLAESMRFDNEEEFALPPDYFIGLSERIAHRISLENIRTKAPSDGLIVPEGYFETLSGKINAKVQQTAKREVTVRRLFRSWVSYAAAACVTIAIGASIYFNSASYQINRDLSNVSDQEIINYLQVHSTAGDTPFIIENISADEFEQISIDVPAEELEDYLRNTTL